MINIHSAVADLATIFWLGKISKYLSVTMIAHPVPNQRELWPTALSKPYSEQYWYHFFSSTWFFDTGNYTKWNLVYVKTTMSLIMSRCTKSNPFHCHQWHHAQKPLWPGGRFKNTYELLNLRSLKFSLWIKSTSFNLWVRYFVWNFKGTLWNSTQNIFPIHWNI